MFLNVGHVLTDKEHFCWELNSNDVMLREVRNLLLIGDQRSILLRNESIHNQRDITNMIVPLAEVSL